MKARLVILVVILVGVACVWTFKDPGDPTKDYDADGNQQTSVGKTKGLMTDLANVALPGAEPPVAPEFDVTVEVDTSDGRNKLIYRITERHGYFVETLHLDLHFMPTGGTADDEVRAFNRLIVDYIPVNDTLTSVDFVVPAELANCGGSIGESSNWRGEVVGHGRARLEDPDSWEGYKVRENNRE